ARADRRGPGRVYAGARARRHPRPPAPRDPRGGEPMIRRRRGRWIAAALALALAQAAPAPVQASPPSAGEASAEAPRIWAAIVPRGPEDDLAIKTDALLRAGIGDGLRRGGAELVEAGAGS